MGGWRSSDRHNWFSRGAALGLQFSNVINDGDIRVGKTVVEKPQIRFLGLWDVHASFGTTIDILVFNFQDVDMGFALRVPDNITHCFHAMALNERHEAFEVIRLNVGKRKSKIEKIRSEIR